MIKARNVLVTALVVWGCSISMASAAVFNVNTTVDAVDSDTSDGVCLTTDGECSLRAAIQQANASSDADEVNLPAGTYELSLEGIKDDEGATGDLDVKSEITINGSGADQVAIDGIQSDRVFEVHTGANLTLNSLTVRNGNAGQQTSGGGIQIYQGALTVNDCNITLNGIAFGVGGGINSFRGTVVINRSTVSENYSMNAGGGISNQSGRLTINDSTIRDNGSLAGTISVLGGGIYNASMIGFLHISNSTISGNDVSVDGGGIYHLIGTMKITNSTISDNFATRNGGGLFVHSGSSAFGSDGNTLVNVTIANNGADAYDSTGRGRGGGGIYVEGAVPMEFTNTIVANSTAGGDCFNNNGEIMSLGNNLDTDGSCELSSDASSINGGDAGLGNLADNGGPTLTHALLANSEALDAGDNDNCPAIDQRNYARVDSSCDIGAFEDGAQAPVTLLAGPPPPADADNVNHAPTVLDLVLAVEAGGSVTNIATGVDPDGDTLVYEVLEWPTKGNFGWEWEGSDPVAGAFTYVADVNAIGSDTIIYQVCDQSLCSDPATVSIAISATATAISSAISIEVVSQSSGATVSQVQIVSSDALEVNVADVDYTQPLDIFFFSVDNIPTDADSQLNGTEIVIQLPLDAIIDENATVRKLDKFNAWHTLPEVADPGRPNMTTGRIDPDAKTLTLVLHDNDEFDLDPTIGVILDPVAISVPKVVGDDTTADDTTADDTTADDTTADDTTADDTTADDTAADDTAADDTTGDSIAAVAGDDAAGENIDSGGTGGGAENVSVEVAPVEDTSSSIVDEASVVSDDAAAETTDAVAAAFHPVMLLLFGLLGLRWRKRS